jgi:chemotaxis receptor (MCP) glutamine deamidase CheD
MKPETILVESEGMNPVWLKPLRFWLSGMKPVVEAVLTSGSEATLLKTGLANGSEAALVISNRTPAITPL